MSYIIHRKIKKATDCLQNLFVIDSNNCSIMINDIECVRDGKTYCYSKTLKSVDVKSHHDSIEFRIFYALPSLVWNVRFHILRLGRKE